MTEVTQRNVHLVTLHSPVLHDIYTVYKQANYYNLYY